MGRHYILGSIERNKYCINGSLLTITAGIANKFKIQFVNS